MNRWLTIIFTIIFLTSAAGVFSGFFTTLFGRLVFGSLWRPLYGFQWQPFRFKVPKLRFGLAGIFGLFLLIQVAIAITQPIWPVIRETPCWLVTLPQGVETRLAEATPAPRTIASSQVKTLDVGDRALASAIPIGIAAFAWLMGSILIQGNHIERTVDRLVVLLFVAPLGTLCSVLVPSVTGFFLLDLINPPSRPLPIDSILWHGVVLLGGGLLGVIYCRAVANWLAQRADQPALAKGSLQAENT